MRYSVFAGGKRLRPVLCLAAAEACGGEISNALAAGLCGGDPMHTYSLVHDDLPCMDDDDLRRGRPTCHKVYGEGMAVLRGDALAHGSLHRPGQGSPTRRYARPDYVAELAETGGSRKLIGGQVMDLEGEGKKLTKRDLVRIHEAKTAALLTASLRLGAMTANATPAKLEALTTSATRSDSPSRSSTTSSTSPRAPRCSARPPARTRPWRNPPIPAILGLDASRKEAARLTKAAMDALQPFGTKAPACGRSPTTCSSGSIEQSGGIWHNTRFPALRISNPSTTR